MNILEQYIRKNAGTLIDYDWVYGSQCVDLIKHYSKNVLWIPLGTFWGSARTGWQNRSNTFTTEKWEWVVNDKTRPDQVPNIWDVIFFNIWDYGHVAIVRSADPGRHTFEVFEQNTGDANGYGYDDRCRVNTYNYSLVYGWYTPKKFYIEYRWVPVHFIEPYKNILWYYGTTTKAIYITPSGHKKEDFEILMEHEWSHHIYWSEMSKKDVKLWEEVSGYSNYLQKWLSKYMPGKYWYNKYISPGETNASEDFAETWEDIKRYPNKEYGDIRDFKRRVVQRLISKYTDE